MKMCPLFSIEMPRRAEVFLQFRYFVPSLLLFQLRIYIVEGVSLSVHEAEFIHGSTDNKFIHTVRDSLDFTSRVVANKGDAPDLVLSKICDNASEDLPNTPIASATLICVHLILIPIPVLGLTSCVTNQLARCAVNFCS
jgi:hypothetical protein